MNNTSAKEHAIEDYLCQEVARAGGVAEKVTVIGARGFFDRLVVLPGPRVIFVECKRPSGSRLAIHQIWYRNRYRALGCEVVVIKTHSDVDRLLSPR